MAKVLMNWKLWVYGLLAALIGGGAHAVVALTTVTWLAPDKFNLTTQLHNFILLVVVTFACSGILSAAAYLSKSPLPPLVTTTEEDQIIKLIPEGGVSIKTTSVTTEEPKEAKQ